MLEGEDREEAEAAEGELKREGRFLLLLLFILTLDKANG
jgi:hypothetical protein